MCSRISKASLINNIIGMIIAEDHTLVLNIIKLSCKLTALNISIPLSSNT